MGAGVGGCSALPITPSGPGELFEASSAPAWPRLRWIGLWAGGPDGGGPPPLPAESGDRPSPHSTCPPRVHILPGAQTLASPNSPSPLTGTGAEPRRGLTSEWTGLSAQVSAQLGGIYNSELRPGRGMGPRARGRGRGTCRQADSDLRLLTTLFGSRTHTCHPLRPRPT